MNNPQQKQAKTLEEEFLRYGTTFKISQALNDKVRRRMDIWVGEHIQFVQCAVHEAIERSMKPKEE